MSNENFTVLGVDPGSRLAGYGVLRWNAGEWRHVENGTMKLNAKAPLSIRLLQLSDTLSVIFEKYKPQLTVIEQVFLGKNVSSAFTLGHARGVILLEAARFQSQVEEYAPRAVKKGVTGHGGADKLQVMAFLKSIFNIKDFETEDASDALALALHGARQWQKVRHLRERGLEL